MGQTMRFDFTGKSVLVTGANRGIGLGVAEGFLAAGASVVIAALEEDVRDVAAQLGARYGRDVTGVVCDISDRDQIAALAERVDRLDVLVNNAGLEYITPIADPSPDVERVFRDIIAINVIGTFEVTRALLAKIPEGGRIINTSSMWGKTAVGEYSAYCASKHAVIGLTRSLSRELGPRRIAVNAVCPGWVRTVASMRSLGHMAQRLGRSEAALLEEIVGAQSFDGLMAPEDMIDIYLFLASDAARNITGQAYTVDRGETMH